jgi:hypothetical protein
MTETHTVPAQDAADRDAAAANDRTRTYRWADPMTLAAEVIERSGMDLFAALGQGRLPLPPIMSTLGVDGVEVPEVGRFTVYMHPREFHYNPIGSVHGGVI